MALTHNFKIKLESALRMKLKTHHVSLIEHEYENVICGHNSILTDCRVELTNYNLELLLEIERKRVDPAHNLIKTLMWLEESKPTHPIILLHVFDVAYSAGDRPNKAMCDYLYSKMNGNYPNFYYHSLNIGGLSDANLSPPRFSIKKVCNRIADISNKLVTKKGPRLR